MKSLRLLTPLFSIWLFLHPAAATSYAPPSDEVIKSPNGRFELHIKAKSGTHTIYQGKKRLWKFKRDVWHHACFLSDDGQHVLWLAWPFVKTEQLEEPALVIYGAKGELAKKSFKELCVPRKYRRNEIGPIGDFWRIWRDGATRKENVVTVEVSGRKSLKIDLATLKFSQ